MLMIIPFVVFGIAFLGACANYGNTLNMRFVGTRIVADMQMRLFNHLMKSDIGLFHNESAGRLISRFTNDVNLLRSAVTQALTGIAKDALTVVFLVALMFHQDWRLALIAFFAFPLAVFPILRIGRRIRNTPSNPWREIVGVIGDERDNGLARPPTPIVYWPLIIDTFWDMPKFVQRNLAFAVRSTRLGSAGFMTELQRAVWSVNPNLPVANVQTLADIRASSMAQTSFALTMLAIAASVALLLSAVVSCLLVGGSLLVVWAGRSRSRPGS